MSRRHFKADFTRRITHTVGVRGGNSLMIMMMIETRITGKWRLKYVWMIGNHRLNKMAEMAQRREFTAKINGIATKQID